MHVLSCVLSFDLEGVRFEIIRYKASQSTVTYMYYSVSAIECATLCGTKTLCFSMNFNRNVCELLSETFGTLPSFDDDTASIYIRKCVKLSYI